MSGFTIKVARGAAVTVQPGEAALLWRMANANAAVERVAPVHRAVDSMRSKRLVRRVQADHPVPIYALTAMGQLAAAKVAARHRKLALASARRAAAIVEAQANG